MPPTLADRLVHMLDAIRDIERALSGKTRDDFSADRILRLAIERLLEIVCEASRHIPDHVKKSNAAIPWQKVLDFGNRLRHAYHSVDVDIVWNIIENDIPILRGFAEDVIRKDGR